jgi:glycolate oxidase iron-sulfur subunit
MAELTLAMRTGMAKPARWKKALFEGVIPHPGRMEMAMLPLRLYEALGIRRLVYALRLTRLLPKQIRDMEAMLPRLPQRPLRQILPELPKRAERQTRVGFFSDAPNLLFADNAPRCGIEPQRLCSHRMSGCCSMPAQVWTPGWCGPKRNTIFLYSKNPKWM